MKSIIAFQLIFLLGSGIYAQKWEHVYGLPNQNESTFRVLNHYDKGYIVTASIANEYNDYQGWVLKADVNGNLLWDKVIGVAPDQVFFSKTVYDNLGNLYLFGTIVQGIEPLWPVAVKINECGELQWCKQLYFEEYEFGQFYDAILLDNGDLLAVANMPNDGQVDMIFLFCISPDGEYRWKQSYASRNDYPNFEMRLGSRIQIFDDIYIISGYVYSPHPDFPTISSLRPMFIGIDTLFNEQWVLEFGLQDNMKGKALTSIPINDSLFIGVGRHRYYDSTGDTQDAWAMFYNQQGEQTGYQVITADKLGSGITESSFYEIERVNDSIFLSTAGYYYDDDDKNAKGEIVFDTAGNVYQYALREGTAGGNTSVIKTFDDKFVVACSYRYPDLSYDVYLYKINQQLEQDTVYPGNYTYDSLCPYPIESGVIDLSGCDVVTSIEEIPTLEQYRRQQQSITIKASPNPSATGEVLLELENTGAFTNIQLRINDAYGNHIHTQSILSGQGAIAVDIATWPPGIYIAVVYSDGTARGKAKFVVR